MAILNHNDHVFKRKRKKIGRHKYNGAYYYSVEICENIIPRVNTDRNWMTLISGTAGFNHSICFVHDNLNFENSYRYTTDFDDLIYVVGLPDMVERAEKFGKTVYLPLSVDTKYVKQFRSSKTKKLGCFGRDAVKWVKEYNLPKNTDIVGLVDRESYLTELAKYEKVYAIGRTAVEAKVLGCEVLPFHPRLMDVGLWQSLDNIEAAKILQKELDLIDK